ncbi:hypothetical protein E4U58_006227, partial [Claviceps cyperi]
MPAEWTPLLTPKQLSEECGTYYRDENAAFYPKYPLEPAVTLDLLGCGSTLGNLLRFVQGKSLNFRIIDEVVGPVVHLVRRQKSPLETIPELDEDDTSHSDSDDHESSYLMPEDRDSVSDRDYRDSNPHDYAD